MLIACGGLYFDEPDTPTIFEWVDGSGLYFAGYVSWTRFFVESLFVFHARVGMCSFEDYLRVLLRACYRWV